MSIIVYKQRHSQPNHPSTPSKNKAHIEYIATRPRVMRNEGMRHGLFGKLDYGEIQHFETCTEIASLVEKNSYEEGGRLTLFRAVISFEEETAFEMGLQGQAEWKTFLERHIQTLAFENKIPLHRFQWVAAVHEEKGHPHLHIAFWDKHPTIQKQLVHYSIPNNIRKRLIKDTFGDRILEVGKEKDRLAKEIRGATKEVGNEVTENVKLLGKKRYELIRALYREGLKDYQFQFPSKIINVIAPQIFALKNALPESGRLNYQLLPIEIKEQVDQIVEDILRDSPEIAQAVEDYVEKKCQQTAFYGSVTPEKREKFRNEATNMVANGVMNMVRGLNQLSWEYQKERFREMEQHFITEQILDGILELLRSVENKGITMNRKSIVLRGDLSKEAKKEYALRNQDKGYEH